ncbi:MAG: ferrous iron transport protein A [Pyrinomonadaceae bacterium]|nr:ferrous iron transport protein A [Pyrinomonadaceae bacterium]
MTLAEIPIGNTVRVKAVRGNSRIATRLMEMGVVPGVAVEIVKSAPFGDPIQLRLLGYSLAVRKSEADIVDVEALAEMNSAAY